MLLNLLQGVYTYPLLVMIVRLSWLAGLWVKAKTVLFIKMDEPQN